MKAVVNAGPLIALGKLGLVHLLHPLYGTVLVPSAVYEEVVTRGLELGQPDAHSVQLAVARHELVVVNMPVAHVPDVSSDWPLHRGEQCTIELAQREAADWVLLDEQLAREHAQRLGLQVKGTLGVIVEASRRGLLALEEVELVFQSILDRDDIWISVALTRGVWDALRNTR